MAPVIPNPRRIKSFRTEAAFAAWMEANHARETEIWLKIHKKGSGLASVSIAQALDVALCWGWIDGIRKAFDEPIVSPALHAAAAAKCVEPDQSRSCRAAHRGRAHDATRPAASRCCQGGWPLGRGVRSHAQRERGDDSRRSSRRHRGQSRGTQDFPHARSPESVRAGVSHQQHENASRARKEDRGAGRHACARRDHLSGTTTPTVIDALRVVPERGQPRYRAPAREAANGFSSAVGPYTDGTGTSSSRR